MKRAKNRATSLVASILVIGFGMMANACTGVSPLGNEDGDSVVQEQSVLPDSASPTPDPPPPPSDGGE